MCEGLVYDKTFELIKLNIKLSFLVCHEPSLAYTTRDIPRDQYTSLTA